MGEILDRRGWFNGEHCQSHNISGFHVSLLRFSGAPEQNISVSGTHGLVLIVPDERKRIDLAQKTSRKLGAMHFV
jgi:hypothetical protein